MLDEVRIWNADLSNVSGTNYLTSTNLRNESFSENPETLGIFYPQLATNLRANYSFDNFDGRNNLQDLYASLAAGVLQNGALLDLSANAPVTFLALPAVPEPTSVALFVVCLGGLGVWQWRRRQG